MTTNGIQASREDVWYLKAIDFGKGESRQRRKIITQNFNGPCSFIAICNILLLRGDIEIEPAERTSVSYEFLSQLVGEYLLTHCPDVDISAALSIMPLTTKGMDLNPLFTSYTAFRPGGPGSDGAELELFKQTGIQLVHGWLVDPASAEYPALAKTEDYDSSVNLLVGADYLTKGRLVESQHEYVLDEPVAGFIERCRDELEFWRRPEHTGTKSLEEDHQKVKDAMAVQAFLDTTSSQLTYYGLFTLASALPSGALVALFRNAHLSVLYKSENSDGESALYQLATDHSFLHEPTVVWERLEDVEGGQAAFVDADLRRSSPAGGDFAGETGESALRALEQQFADLNVDPADQALAAQLQAEEDAHAQQLYAQRQERQRAEQERRTAEEAAAKSKKSVKKKTSCVIM